MGHLSLLHRSDQEYCWNIFLPFIDLIKHLNNFFAFLGHLSTVHRCDFNQLADSAIVIKSYIWSNIFQILASRELTCHASAWDFYNKKDFRIKQCTRFAQSLQIDNNLRFIIRFLCERFIDYPMAQVRKDVSSYCVKIGIWILLPDTVTICQTQSKHLQRQSPFKTKLTQQYKSECNRSLY